MQREDLERSLTELESLRDELAETVERRFEETPDRGGAPLRGGRRHALPGRQRPDRPRRRRGRRRARHRDRAPARRQARDEAVAPLRRREGARRDLVPLRALPRRPCPFYLLDEVEAALDDANIGRFTELLRRFADRAQFIVVTHQKRTIEAADILYGVTMGADGISQVVSKRLAAAPEAEALSA